MSGYMGLSVGVWRDLYGGESHFMCCTGRAMSRFPTLVMNLET